MIQCRRREEEEEEREGRCERGRKGGRIVERGG